jgi:hypothetical protein
MGIIFFNGGMLARLWTKAIECILLSELLEKEVDAVEKITRA